MGDITQFADFAAGVQAGQDLIQLTRAIGSDFATKPQATADQLDKVVSYIRRFTPANRPYPAVEGFVRTVLREEETDAGILTTLGANSFVDYQSSWAPCCNLPAGSPLVQFAYWCGEEDGDAWVFDLGDDTVRCLPVSMEGKQLVEVRAATYGVFRYLGDFVAVLSADAKRRRWIPLQDPQRS